MTQCNNIRSWTILSADNVHPKPIKPGIWQTNSEMEHSSSIKDEEIKTLVEKAVSKH